MPDKKISDLVDGGAPQNTDEFVVARAGDNFKLAWSSLSSSQSVQTQNAVDVSVSGNTAGVPALVSSGTLSLAGGNNITLSQVGNAVTISGAAIPAESQTFIAAISASDTLYTSGSVRFTGSQAITVRSGTGQLVVIDAPAQSVQPETQTFVAGISASDTLYTSGNVRLTGVGGGVTVSSNTGQRVDISVAAQSVQPETQTFVGGISASDTLYTSGSVRFTGSQAVTVRSGTGQLVVIDVPAQTTQVETQTFIGGVSASDTLYTSGTVRITGVGGGITVSSNTGQRIDLSVAAQSVQPETQTFIGGISASDTLYTSGSVRFTGVGGGVTVSSNTGQRVDISVAAPVAQTNQAGSVYASSNTFGTSSGTYDARSISIAGRGAVSVAASNSGWIISAPVQSTQAETQTFIGGISASDTLYTSGTVQFTGVGGGVTVSSNTGQRVDISVAAQSVQTQGAMSAGVSNLGNTLGSTGVTGTRLVLAGIGEITLSQGTDASGGTVSISNAPNGTVSMWPNQVQSIGTVAMTTAAFNTGATRTTYTGFLQPMAIEAPLSFNMMRFPMAVSFTTTASNSHWSWTMGHSLGIYSVTGASLSLHSSFSNLQQISYASAANSTNASMTWNMSYGSSTALSSSRQVSSNNAGVAGPWISMSSGMKWWPLQTGNNSMSVGQYFYAHMFSSSSVGANLASVTQIGVHSVMNALVLQDVGRATASSTANWPLQGWVTLTQTDTGVMPATFATADVTQSSSFVSITNRSLYLNMLSQFYAG